ncbi:MAG TPA: hypothetical protein VJL58_00675 [Pyrinomonadaceae bacterium]|nr:hypothetical protein [Pyrinomonadaceae bacterium]
MSWILMLIFAFTGIGAQTHSEEFAAEKNLANLTLEAHGGKKLRAMKTLVIRGSVDVATSGFQQSIPATFVTIYSGDKYRLEIDNPLQPFKQIYDGTQTSSTIRGGFTLPPINRLGLPLLPRIGETGFIITPLPPAKKGRHGFRITSPEGYFTDFYTDEKTNQIKGYDSTYDINGRTITTSVEIDKCRVVDGLTIPEKYAQRFDMDRLSVYSTFKAKEILVNSAIADEVFAIREK